MNFNTDQTDAQQTIDVHNGQEKEQSHDGQMQVICSGILRKNGEKIIYVRFECADAFAEGSLPAAKITSHSGFDAQELEQLEQYLDAHSSEIVEQARGVNLMKNFLNP